MRKFLAVLKREYMQRVRSKMFIVATVLGPLMMGLFMVVPAFIANIKTGGPTRLAIVDETGTLYHQVRTALLKERGEDEDDKELGNNVTPGAESKSGPSGLQGMRQKFEQSYEVQQVIPGTDTLETLKRKLDERVKKDELDMYLILPKDILQSGSARYYSRNTGDMFTREQIKDRLTRAIHNQRMTEKNISPSLMSEINMPIKMRAARAGDEKEEEDTGQGFGLVFAIGFIIYITLVMYGQVILGAVIEEKETRISEMLFSSMRAFPLMMGKLIGISLVALTQYAIWGIALGAFALFGVGMLATQGMPVTLPRTPPSVFVYFLLFFLLGYFIYATIYALVGAMVTTAQEGGQLALPVIFLLVIGFYLAFPVLRSPDSSFAFWVSMVPFFSPITMLVRIVTQTPPFWEIALSLLIGFSTVVLLIWLAARVYRVGMLMYGKRASIPEMLRWVRQS